MATTEQPITRSELREELDRLMDNIRERYATKEDLANLKVWMLSTMVTVVATATAVIIAVYKLWPN